MTPGTIRKIDPLKPEPVLIAEAAEILKGDGFIVSPTETRYGLLARADKPEIFNNISALKKRSLNKPAAIFISDVNDIENWGILTPVSKKLAASFLPGPLTLVLTARPGITAPPVFNNTIGVRISSSPVVAALLQSVKFPLSATSANLSGRPEPETIGEIIEIFGPRVNLYLDSGRLSSLTSTIVECINNGWRILRRGAIPATEIEQAIKGI